MSAVGADTVQPNRSPVSGLAHALAPMPAWFWIAVGTFALMVLLGGSLLADPDTLWQVKIGQWIIAQHALPQVDIYSWTKAGTAWISSSWLSQVLFAATYAVAGWAGVVALSSLAIAATFALLTRILERRVAATYAICVTMLALALSAQHLLARPHVLAMPVMVAWVGGLIAASDARVKPSFWLLPLIALWANLHGGFVLGLALIGPIALDAVWTAQASQRKRLAVHWVLFGVCALAASCLTPYGWNSLLASQKILGLGDALNLITEWRPIDFAQFGVFEGGLLLLIGAALYFGVVLPPLRILLTLGLLHMALNHVRNVEVFALLTPLVVLAPLADRFGWHNVRPAGGQWLRAGTAVIALVMLAAAGALAATRQVQPPNEGSAAAIAALRAHHAARVFNDYDLGGAMIWQDMPPFIDGRTELYGARFTRDHMMAMSLAEPSTLFRLLDGYRIDATLLRPGTPAAQLLDHLDGWSKVFASDWAVVHVRTAPSKIAPAPSGTGDSTSQPR
ncbi:hypothetical protein [Bradyrhizobium prioriisuperbiae]|uniref:hypothetical protein n=1 Tax=Bradyrhizobium prioriisuperbiae TaxID=2854389 RepID=UPI0028EE4705|nr:hypothetical protein [Bradyrhizobium prioritasuperba]